MTDARSWQILTYQPNRSRNKKKIAEHKNLYRDFGICAI